MEFEDPKFVKNFICNFLTLGIGLVVTLAVFSVLIWLFGPWAPLIIWFGLIVTWAAWVTTKDIP